MLHIRMAWSAHTCWTSHSEVICNRPTPRKAPNCIERSNAWAMIRSTSLGIIQVNYGVHHLMQKSVFKPPMRWPLLTIDTTSTLAALHLRKIDRSMSCFVCCSDSFVFGRCHILFVILTLLFRFQVSVGVTGGQHSKGNWYFMHIHLCSVYTMYNENYFGSALVDHMIGWNWESVIQFFQPQLF